MNNREIFERVCAKTSRDTTRSFSTSFSLGIAMLDKHFHEPIYAIYGFVRFADEIVDTFHGHPQQRLLDDFKRDTCQAIADGISLNPILHSFQKVVHEYGIGMDLIDTFLASMQMDLRRQKYDQAALQSYVLGSAEVVGLMCLRVFAEGNDRIYEELKGPAMKLGSAFQKVNFLRDLAQDANDLGRSYFPDVDPARMTEEQKRTIENGIEAEMREALEGIVRLPKGARMGVRLAYLYYRALLNRIRSTPAHRMLHQRIRVPQGQKMSLLLGSYVRYRLNLSN